MWARLGFALLCAAFVVGFFVYPTYPNYDSYYSLLWGRELLDGDPLSFTEYRAPTQHPLAIAAGALLSLLGTGADRVWVALTLLAFLLLVWGVYRLGRVSFTPLVGAVAAVLLVSRFDFPFLAARGYIDVPYLALVVWAAALEAERPRRGTAVLVLLALAGLLRPEAWVLAGLYFLWASWPASWLLRARFAALAAVGPVVWALVDLAVTGDPLFSLTYTSSSAEELGRQRSLSEVPAALPVFFSNLVKPPVVLGGVLGIALAVWLSPRRAIVPGLVLLSGIGTFVAIALAGLSVIDRYLTAAALALLVFAAVALAGWTMLARGRLRGAWMAAAALLVAYGALYTVQRVNFSRLDNELSFRGEAHAALADAVRADAIRAGLRCGPVSVPNHKLVPDVRWLMDLGADRVVARTDERAAERAGTGAALYVTSRVALFKQALSSPTDGALVQVPPPGFRRGALTPYYAAYGSC